MVQGEENNEFSNTSGESVIVQDLGTCEETVQLLAKVMDSDIETAKLLATEVHREIELSDVPTVLEIPYDFNISIEDVGIWIDPIDSTADYINGVETVHEASGIHLSGLRCVTVLIGAYLKSTGLPILGVVNQPFYNSVDSEWKGICYWGYMENDNRKCSIENINASNNIIVLSRFEEAEIKSKLSEGGFTLIEAAGAGYKILSVVLGHAAAYILSKGSTYRWDTCAPQALLRSLGGGIIEFKRFLADPDSEDLNLKYLPTGNNFSNSDGLIAYHNPEILKSLKSILCECI